MNALPPPSSTPGRSGRTVAVALAATTGVQALVTMSSLAVSVYAPQAARDIGVAPERIGIYASVTYVGAMVGTLVAGGFVLRYGAIRCSQAAMVICAAGLAVCTGAHWSLFLLSALVLGLGYGPTTPASSHLLSRHTPPRFVSVVFSIKQTGVPLGGMLTGLLVPLLLVYFNWQVVSWIIVAIVIAGAGGLELSRRTYDVDLRPSQPLVSGNVVGPLRLIFQRANLRRLAVATFFFSATQQSYVYFLVTYLEIGIGWSNQQAGFALALVGAAAVAGRVFWGAIADATSRSQAVLAVIAFGMSACAAVTSFFAAHWPPWAIYTACAAFGATGVAWNGVYLAEITRRVEPDEVGRATGGGLFVTFAGVMITPPLFGLLAEVTGSFSAGYLTLAGATLAVGVVMLIPEQ